MLSRYESAIFYYSQATQLDPYLAIAYFLRGNCYSNAGDSFQAALDFTVTLDVCYFIHTFHFNLLIDSFFFFRYYNKIHILIMNL